MVAGLGEEVCLCPQGQPAFLRVPEAQTQGQWLCTWRSDLYGCQAPLISQAAASEAPLHGVLICVCVRACVRVCEWPDVPLL